MNLKVFYLLSISFIIFGCELNTNLGLNSQGAVQLVPKDEATPAERLKIDATLTKIENIAHELAYTGNFRSIPIVVVTEDPIKMNRMGYCAWDGNGNGEFITINRAVFDNLEKKPRAEYLFAVLLHEIGHCYFKRNHSAAVLEKPGFHFIFEVADELGGTQFSFAKMPVSIMYSDRDEKSSTLTGAPLPLQKYFVSELLGQAQIHSIDELVVIPGLRIVPNE